MKYRVGWGLKGEVWVEGTVTTSSGVRELVGDNCSSESRHIRERGFRREGSVWRELEGRKGAVADEGAEQTGEKYVTRERYLERIRSGEQIEEYEEAPGREL